MKLLPIAALALSLQSYGNQLCGFITLEHEGTWLEVALSENNPMTSYQVYNLLNENFETYELNQEQEDAVLSSTEVKVCVNYSALIKEENKPDSVIVEDFIIQNR